MNRAEIMEGLKEIYYRLYAITDHRKTLEACFKLLENENALIDKVLEIIDSRYEEYLTLTREGVQPTANMLQNSIREDVFSLRGGTE